MTIQLNLLPDVKKEYLKSQKTKALVISTCILVTLGAVAVSALLFLYVTFGQELQMGLIGNDIKSKTSDLNNVKDLNKYLTIQNQLAALPDLHDQKGIYSRLFGFLPILNPSAPNNLKLSTLQLAATETDQSIVFTGTTATFESLNIFVDTLNNALVTYQQPNATGKTSTKIFTAVIVQSSSLSEANNVKSVAFTIRTNYNPAVFDARNTGMTASVPNIVTTPSVTGSTQPQLFDQSGGQ